MKAKKKQIVTAVSQKCGSLHDNSTCSMLFKVIGVSLQFFTCALIAAVIIIGVHPVHAASISYTYDDAGRLIEADYGEGIKFVYTYDAAGNLLSRRADYFTSTPTPTVTSTPTPTSTPTSTPTGGTTRRVPADYETIQEAVAACIDGDTVLISEGTYTGAANKNIDFGGKAITIKSEEGKGLTVIDCEGDGRAFLFQSGEEADSRLEGLTIRNGYAPEDYGACVYCENSSPVITDCDFQNTMDLWHQCYYGAGIMCWTSSPVINDCTFLKNNAAIGGGGICCTYGSDPVISRCTFIENVGFNLFVDGGGGIYVHSYSDPAINDCTFKNNEGRFGGGIMANFHSNPNIADCRFYRNYAHGSGGGVACEDQSAPTISNCYFSVNSSHSDGGAVVCYDSATPLITYCTFIGNTSSSNGGALMNYGGSDTTVENCVFIDNEGTYIGGCGAVCNWSAITITSCWFEDNRGTCDPEFGPDGGALCLRDQSTLNNCIIVNNYTRLNGGGIHISGGNTEIVNCTLADNLADETLGHGYGLYCENGASVQITNSILWDTEIPDEEIYIEDGTVTVDYSDVRGGWSGPGGNNTNVDPEFASGPYGEYHLDYTSPCLNIGSDLAENICFPISSGEVCMDELGVLADLSTDAGVVDLGYHYPNAAPTPTWTPTVAPTGTAPVETLTPTQGPYTNTPTRTPASPTVTPSITASVPATVTPTQACQQTGVTLEMPAEAFTQGDPCFLWAWVCNQSGGSMSENPLFIVLDVYQEYWFGPSWIFYEEGADWYAESFQHGMNKVIIIDEFAWPENAGSATGIKFHGALTDPDITRLEGSMDTCTFGWN